MPSGPLTRPGPESPPWRSANHTPAGTQPPRGRLISAYVPCRRMVIGCRNLLLLSLCGTAEEILVACGVGGDKVHCRAPLTKESERVWVYIYKGDPPVLV